MSFPVGPFVFGILDWGIRNHAKAAHRHEDIRRSPSEDGRSLAPATSIHNMRDVSHGGSRFLHGHGHSCTQYGPHEHAGIAGQKSTGMCLANKFATVTPNSPRFPVLPKEGTVCLTYPIWHFTSTFLPGRSQ